MEEPQEQQQWGIINCLAPIFIIIAMFILGRVGYIVGARYGIGKGILGILCGVIVAIPVAMLVLVIMMLLVLGAAWLYEYVSTGKRPKFE